MAILPVQLARVSNLLQSGVAEQSISSTQAQLITVQNELSTGLQVNQPSDNPSAAALILSLNKTLAQRTAYATNINTASSQLGTVDSTLNSLSQLLLQASNIAQRDVQTSATANQRNGDAQVVNSLLTEVQNLANTQSNGVYIFGGDKSNQPPYISASGGVQFVGSANVLQTQVDQNLHVPSSISGPTVFGGLSTRVNGSNANVATTPTTQLTDLSGANNNGVNLGKIQLSDGTTTATIDLSQAQTLGDVATAINASGIGSITATVGANGLSISGGPADNITITDLNSTTASDLGILTPPGGIGAGVAVNGAPLNPTLTPLTPLSSLVGGVGLDPTGITLSNGVTTKTLSFASVTTVQGLLNAINGAGLGVSAQINSSGTGINVLNTTQGTTLTISENGGQTATQLGIRSFSPTSNLSELNNGQGVGLAPAGSNGDFTITDSNGNAFNVSLAGAKTVQDVIDAINADAATAGAGVTAGFTTTGNGIELDDSAGGGQTLTVQAINASSAAADLGLTSPAVGATITGSDVNGIQTPGVFSDLTALAQALVTGNQNAINLAAQNLANDNKQANDAQGLAGAQSQSLTNRQSQLETQNIATMQLLSNVQDVDMTAAISEFQTLQTALQASLQTTAIASNLTLLNFISG